MNRSVLSVSVAAVAGCCIACAVFLVAERLTPVEVAGRDDIPVRAFWLVWATSFLHAALRPARQAWVEQLVLTALICLVPPWLQGLAVRDLMTADWVRLTVDATLLATGLLFAFAAWKVRSAPAIPVRKRKARATQASEGETAEGKA